jgi:putative membrane protein
MNTTTKVAMLGMGACLFAGAAWGADPPPTTADVLNKLHNANLTQIEAGKLAQDNGHTQATKDYGKMLVTDRTSADEQVMALAKEENIDLSASTPVVGAKRLAELTAGPAFDRRFARSMLDDQKKEIAKVTAALYKTRDPKLQDLLTALLPTLQKHESMAESLQHGK